MLFRSAVHDDGATIIMVTHDPVVAARADRVVYLRDGQLIDDLHLSDIVKEDIRSRQDELQGWLGDKGF